MLAKLKAIREEREDGFTLIELLVVILIIGILSAIAIPVFLNQRKTANDSAVQSDVKNAAAQVETWITEQRGGKVALSGNTPEVNTVIAQLKSNIKISEGVKLAIKGDSNSYCIVGVHTNGKQYTGEAINPEVGQVLTYENSLGGMNKGYNASSFEGACAGATAWKSLN